MDFFNGLKQTLKIDEMASGVASRLSTAKDFVQNQQHNFSELGPVRSVKEKVGALLPSQLQNLRIGSYLSPSSWVRYFPAAKGNRQSPIDICASQAQFDPSLGDGNFDFRYEPEDCVEVCNVGTTWQITTVPQCKSTLTATHLPATYVLVQIHCHWGTEPMNGSEHVIGGVGYAGEIHLVHRNVNYSTADEALKHPDGFAVLAVFLNETLDDNLSLEPLIQVIGKIKYKNDMERFPQRFDVRCLIPEKREFWTYEGSLTTPPCCECVIWTVFRSAIPISSRQIEVFRTLYAIPMEDLERNPVQLLNNIRDVQPLNSRTIRASFRAGGLSAN